MRGQGLPLPRIRRRRPAISTRPRRWARWRWAQRLPAAGRRLSGSCLSCWAWGILARARSARISDSLHCLLLDWQAMTGRVLPRQVAASLRALSTEIDRLDQVAADRYGLNRTDMRALDIVG